MIFSGSPPLSYDCCIRLAWTSLNLRSAVDAHVGRHLFTQALTGPLGLGRTRILVTHHSDIALTRAVWTVLLENGSLKFAGPTKYALGLNRTLVSMCAEDTAAPDLSSQGHEHFVQATKQNENIPNRESPSNKIAAIPEAINSSESPATDEIPGKKFLQKERRERGAIKFAVYAEYMRCSGGYALWIWVIALFGIFEAAVLGRSYFISLWTRSATSP